MGLRGFTLLLTPERCRMLTAQFAIIDLFAGPGGLAEGFSKVRRDDETEPFRIAISVEKDAAAHSTLRLRSFVRQFRNGPPRAYADWLAGGAADPAPDWSSLFPREWKVACEETLQRTMGNAEDDAALTRRLAEVQEKFGGNTIVVGGPPCQAYSLVGRARNKGKVDYVFEDDDRHELYKSYVKVLRQLKPAAFVMENVKGLLSTKAHGDPLFQRVLADLRAAGGEDAPYVLVSMRPDRQRAVDPDPADFVIHAERHGIPQARHRLFIVGIRSDIASAVNAEALDAIQLQIDQPVTVRDALAGLPRLRSGLSRRPDSADDWLSIIRGALPVFERARISGTTEQRQLFREAAAEALRTITSMNAELPRSDSHLLESAEDMPEELRHWVRDDGLDAVPNHHSRTHMPADLERYLFASLFAVATGSSPKAEHFPARLAPKHVNWKSGKFVDRFKVQLWDQPSSTVTSHISKDGHYYIHPDPVQCRSLTVREAARLQTFPDDYVFLGNRTQQYVQVGNAVPPLLAFKIGSLLRDVLDQAAGAA